MIHPADLSNTKRLLAEGVGKQLPCTVLELRMRAADGSWKVLEASIRNLLLDPNIRGFVINSRDITARRKEQEDLQVSEERLRLAQRAGQIGTWEYSFVAEHIIDPRTAILSSCTDPGRPE